MPQSYPGQHLPARWAKCSTIRDLHIRYTSVVGSFYVHSIAPPRLNRVQADGTILRVLQCEEDDEGADCIAGIQTSGQDNYRKSNAWSEYVGFASSGVKES
jgi:hypothetical protein